jgi:2-dehydropantoate 2-reductase
MAAPSGEAFVRATLAECQSVATAEGHPAGEEAMTRARQMLTARGSSFAASMMRDMLAGGPTEGDHIIGDLVRRAARHGLSVPILEVALANIEVHEARRVKEPR